MLPAGQVLSLFDRVCATSMLQLVREGLKTAGSQPATGKQKRQQQRAGSPDDDGDSVMGDAAPPRDAEEAQSEDLSSSALGILEGLAHVLRHFGLRDQPDLLRLIMETACQVACSPGLSGWQLLQARASICMAPPLDHSQT